MRLKLVKDENSNGIPYTVFRKIDYVIKNIDK